MSDNIKVVVKVRPLISREVEEKLGDRWRVRSNTLIQLDNHGRETDTYFTFDKVYDKQTKTQEVYDDVAKPIVEAAVGGFNGTIFAYGQTSSGKTYTMSGTEVSLGIIPLAVLNLFDIIKEIPNRDFLVRVSYIEIYNETLKDLLNIEKKSIKIHETHSGVKVDVTEKVTASPGEVLEAMKQGEVNRMTGATNMNEESSRSHSIFQITIESREHVEGEGDGGCVNVSQLNLVDLAGSERSGQTGATGLRFKEGTHINKSLSCLALVIKQLSEDPNPNKYVNFRDSKLTRLLQNSLGGNAKTSIICAVTPASIEETISTLQFANRAKAIKNKPKVNVVATDKTMIQDLTKELARLQSELASKKNLLETKNNVEQNLQKQIVNLQKLILNGFGQHSSMNIVGARRKITLPRRVTISTLHNIEEEPVPPVPKFCTPSLKYNPMALSTEFLPIQNTSKLTSVPEETRMVTPPPTNSALGERQVTLHEEIIELDSDDDDNSSLQPCSPYHKCYSSSKTPPCILRKNAKLAEKNLKDIVELTEREKMFTPSVVELLEKQEQSAAQIDKLNEEINALIEKSKEKDATIDALLSKIDKTENDVKTISNVKLDLETKFESKCKEYDTKLTDWEVSYETLAKKAKTREQELLSLLVEETAKIGKPFKSTEDILPVNMSDNESSSTNLNEDHTADLVKEMQSQLSNKNQTIVELETSIFNQKLKIEGLEASSQKLQIAVDDFKNKLTNIETENSYLKSTVDSLNCTVENQKRHLETANKDIQSYNDTIKELQIQLTKKDGIMNMKINESVLEDMIANEEKFIANNDNIKNLIHSFKIALDGRNKEIDTLKSTIESKNELSIDNAALKERIEVKEKQITVLIEEAEKLKDQLNENIAVINKLMQVEVDLTSQLNTVREQNEAYLKQNSENAEEIENLNKANAENASQIKNLKMDNEKLICLVAEKEVNEQEISGKNLVLSKEIEDMNQKISDLERSLNEKDLLMKAANDKQNIYQELVAKAHAVLLKLDETLKKLNYNPDNLPETIQNLDDVLNALLSRAENLDGALTNVTEERDQGVQEVQKLKDKLTTTTDLHNAELASLLAQIKKVENEFSGRVEQLLREATETSAKLNKTRAELETKNQYIIDLEVKLNDSKETIENSRNDILSKENSITRLQEQLETAYAEIETLKQNRDAVVESLTTNLQEVKASLEQLVNEKDVKIIALEDKLANVTSIIEEKYKEVTAALKDTIDNRDKLLMSILKKASKLTDHCDVENSIAYEAISDNVYEQIILTLDKIANHIVLLRTENDAERNDIEELLKIATKEIESFTDRNIKLMNEKVEITNANQNLKVELERITNLNKDLMSTGDLLDQLNRELKMKTETIKIMEEKATEWKEKFAKYESAVKQQMEVIISENEKLKDRKERDMRRLSSECQPDLTQNVKLHDNLESSCHRSRPSLEENFETRSPKSLLTICCNKIINTIQPSDCDNIKNVSSSTSTFKSSLQLSDGQTQTEYQPVTVSILEYEKVINELSKMKEEISELNGTIEELETNNKYLLEEREEVRREIQLLAAPAIELQKKIINHRTNLSTLTATTYAENKLLHSQLKVLKHHHTRYINVSQRDLPAFKTQLNELMTILKENTFVADKQNASFKRYSLPDVLDSNTTMSTFKNESTLDGDLLMLDTNVTMTTSADNTLVGHDHTYLDETQMNFDNEACPPDDVNKVPDPCLISQIETLTNDNLKLVERIEALKEENCKLKEEMHSSIAKSSLFKDATASPSRNFKDMQSSPTKMNGAHDVDTQTAASSTCQTCKELLATEEKLNDKVKNLAQCLEETKTERDAFQQKFDNLTLEVLSTEALTRKLTNLEKDHRNKTQEIGKMNNELTKKNKILKELQEEYDTLSMQMMDNISEADNLKKELDTLKDTNFNLVEKYNRLAELAKDLCPECLKKDEVIKSNSKLNRSLSDSDSSSRYNTICTLQSELHASKEDCKKITEEVATIKNQLERSNISIGQAMDMDVSMGDSNIFTFTKDLDTEATIKPKTTEELTKDVYSSDKIECLKFYIEKTGAGKENMNSDMKIIDVMKMLYNNIVAKHGNEVENLTNKLRQFEELTNQIETQFNHAKNEYAKVTEQLEDSNKNFKTVSNLLNKIRKNTNFIEQEMCHVAEADKNTTLANLFKENLLRVIDTDLGLSLVNVFEKLIYSVASKHQRDLAAIMEQYAKLQSHMENVVTEFNTVNDNLKEIKCQLSAKEQEYDLLKAHKEKIYEISNAVTLDMVKKEKELNETLAAGYKRLVDLNIIAPNTEATLSLSENIKSLFDHLIKNSHQVRNDTEENQRLATEINHLRSALEEKEKAVSTLSDQLAESEKNLENEKIALRDLAELYDAKVEENKTNTDIIRKISQEIEALNDGVKSSEQQISSTTSDCIVPKLQSLKQEYDTLNSINEMISKERDLFATELEKAREVIAKNKADIDKMTSDILLLRESVNDNVSVIESLTLEAKSLMEQNIQLKKQLEERKQEYSRLEINIKTHEKTAEIQSKMIIRLQKQKEECDQKLQEATERYTSLQSECDALKENLITAKEEIEVLKNKKEALEMQVSEVEGECGYGERRRAGEEEGEGEGAGVGGARRRRQSFYDSKRAFTEGVDDNKIEAVCDSRSKPDDLLNNLDEDSSNRSTPIRLSRGRDSFDARDQAERECSEPGSRPSSAAAAAARRRRHSFYDQHRASLPAHAHAQPHDNLAQKLSDSFQPAGDNIDSEVRKLREQVTELTQECEELRERNRELDEECEICAQYLRDSEKLCGKLKKEKTVLEKQVSELVDKLKSPQNGSGVDPKPTFAHASVNTDADWANLHTVVVDRMSFDAEVEKNKKLSRAIEELRYSKQELKSNIAKLQRALDKQAGYRNSEAEGELRERDGELARRLRERDDLCRRLAEDKRALQAKLKELQEELAGNGIALSGRRKRQTLHDQNRSPVHADGRSAHTDGHSAHSAHNAHTHDGATEISDDFLNNQVERDDVSAKGHGACAHQLRQIQSALERVVKEKAALESQLLAAASIPFVNPTMYVATGSAIVQNQQITDVMKENQKLKKINAKLVTICKKRGKLSEANRENEEPAELG